MLILHILRVLRVAARLRKRRRKAAELFVRLDRRTLADIGIGPGTMVSLAREAGMHGLRDSRTFERNRGRNQPETSEPYWPRRTRSAP
jgi:uncharacterized protein YjiS (DUF1127 family)